MSGTHATLTIVADDLTGAADAAGGYGSARTSAVVLGPDVPWPAADVLAVDTESRYLPEQEAADLVGSVVRRSVALGRPVFKKIDSLLRGNVGAELAAALTAISGAERGLAVVAPAFPGTGRTTVGGVVHVDGVPNTDGDHAGDVVASLAAAGLQAGRLTPGPADSPAVLAGRLDRLRTDGADAVVVDAVTDADLEQIARASRLVAGPVLATGSGGLAAHMVPTDGATAMSAPPLPAVDRVLVVVGSYSGPARSQIDELVRRGAEHVELRHRDDGEQAATDQISSAPGDVVLTPDLGIPVDKGNALDVAAALATTVTRSAHRFDALVLTGGETARAVLDALGIDSVRVHGTVEPGVVLSSHPDHRPILVTKAGAFGDAGTLARTVRALRQLNTEE
ncbi:MULTISPECIES: four-carbon acid sugar kinase family protein [unclassified Curtobacterium]|uniref:four-carbon acid sugar kinase family protein n=1 Tax=unclassified Curtobacterium TaxID=257496 RepID=UPI0015E8D7C3|nr:MULTISPECIES: four-carbon acid sugar kinase family protein [unclassified Curtobacterium]